jgi:hypothetical protein
MGARQIIGGATFSPDVLKVLFEAFDDAWHEVSADVSARAGAIDAARLRLATIVLSLAKSGPVDRGRIKTEAVDEFRRQHGVA